MATTPQDLSRHYYSLEEYFALEGASDARWEYWKGDIYCMSGGTPEHGIISSNLHASLAFALRGGPCRALTSDTAIWTPANPPYKYPDASAVCGELQFKRIDGVGALTNPVVIVEVLSPSTAVRDHEAKFTLYQTITTFREYLLVAQDEPRVTHYIRKTDDAWERRDVTDVEASLLLESVGCSLTMREIYEGVTFPTL
jgi:Uma2 family endonuclease